MLALEGSRRRRRGDGGTGARNERPCLRGRPKGGSEERSQGPASRLWRRVVCEGEGMGSGAYLQPEEPDEGGFLGEA